MAKSEEDDSRAKFRAALEKKNKITKGKSSGNDSDGGRRIQESSGKRPKMFRRKSG